MTAPARLVAVLAHRGVKSWPVEDDAAPAPAGPPDVEHLPLAEALSRAWTTDAHALQYLVPDLPVRLNRRALAETPGGVPMPWLTFDIDYPKEGRVDGRAPESWWAEEKTKIARLLAAEPGAIAWRTRGGYRLMAGLANTSITDEADAASWAESYLLAGARLSRLYNINIDPYCRDWQHLQRLPGALRDVAGAPEREPQEVLGDPAAVGDWLMVLKPDFAGEEDAAELDRLASMKEDWAEALRSVRRRLGGTSAGEPAAAPDLSLDLERVAGALVGPVSRVPVGGGRHRLYLHLSGMLLGRGVDPAALPALVEAVAVAAGVDDAEGVRDRVAAARTTAALAAGGQAFTRDGDLRETHPEVAEAVDRALPDRFREQLRAAFGKGRGGGEDAPARPVVEIGVDEDRVADEVVAALAARGALYDRGGVLIDVVAPAEEEVDERRKIRRPPNSPRIVELSVPRLREMVCQACDLEKWDGRSKGKVSCHPPDWLPRAILARGAWRGAQRVVGVSEAPVLRPDGTVASAAGHDPETMTYLSASAAIIAAGLKESPTIEDARAAVAELRGLVRDFPFVDESHFAAWLAALLTPLARHAFDGATPLMVLDANARGSGKTLLAFIIGVLLTGRQMATMAPDRSDDEMRKRITTVAMGGDPTVLIDNVDGVFGGPSIDALLTSTEWRDRLLGSNREVRVDLRTVWYATGNNFQMKADTARRCLHIRLWSPQELPENRTGFAHPHILAYAAAERPRLLRAALTILRAHAVAGRPASGVGTWGSYEGWCRIVRDAVVWSGAGDPTAPREQFQEDADRDMSLLGQMIEGFAEVAATMGGACTVSQALAAMDRSMHQFLVLREALSELLPTPTGTLPPAGKVAYLFRKYRERVVAGRRLTNRGKEGRDHVMRWRVIDVSQK